MKRILVAPDGSEVSDRAIDYAAVMTKDANADLGWQAWGRQKRGAVSWKRRPEAGQPGELRGRRRAMTTSRQGAVRSFTAPTCRGRLPHRRLIADQVEGLQ